MTTGIEGAIKRAIKGGWSVNHCFPEIHTYATKLPSVDWRWLESGDVREFMQFGTIVNQPLFWICLGKSLGWGEYVCSYCGKAVTLKTYPEYTTCEEDGMLVEELYPIKGHLKYWHDFIDWIAAGKDIDSFFEEIIK